MTADIELLPLPEGVDVIFSPDGNGAALDVFTAEQMQDYARACVAHATAAKDAEIERLRAENKDLVKSNEQVQKLALDTLADRDELKAETEALRAELREAWSAVDSKAGWEWKKRAEQAEARAERLAEALRDALECGEDGDWQSARNYINEALRDHDSVEYT